MRAPAKEEKTRVCVKCKKRKKIDSFGWSVNTYKKKYRRRQCKVCRRKYFNGLHKRKKEKLTEKACSKCKEIKPSKDFSLDRRSFSGLSSQCLKCMKKYRDKHRATKEGYEAYRKSNNAYATKMRKTAAGKCRYRVSTEVSKVLKSVGSSKQNNSVWKALPYTPTELVKHLESKFRNGMSWENYGEWHIDHIIPQKFFYFTSMDDLDFQLCWALENLQPLWAADNLKKGSKTMGRWLAEKEKESVKE